MFFDPLWSWLTFDVGMDLGTANTLVYIKGLGILLREPTVVAQHRKSKTTVAVGAQAKGMIGKTSDSIRTIRPISNGVIADFEAAQSLVSQLLSQLHQQNGQWRRVPKPRVVIGVPSLVTEVERRAVIDAAKLAGARQVHLVDESMASALGSGLLTGEAEGRLLVDIGGGTTEIAVVSLDGLAVSRSIPIAGWEMDQAIIGYARDKFQLLIGEQTAEQIKIQIGQAWDQSEQRTAMMGGRDLLTGLPKAARVGSSEIQAALRPVLDQLKHSIKEVLEETPPELAADIAQAGVTLAGGGALITGIDQYFAAELDMPVHIANEPLNAVVMGTAKLLDDQDLLKKWSLPSRKNDV